MRAANMGAGGGGGGGSRCLQQGQLRDDRAQDAGVCFMLAEAWGPSLVAGSCAKKGPLAGVSCVLAGAWVQVLLQNRQLCTEPCQGMDSAAVCLCNRWDWSLSMCATPALLDWMCGTRLHHLQTV